MKLKLKAKLIITLVFSSICSIIFFSLSDAQALTQDEAGQYIAEFAINFCKNYADQTIYSWTDSHRFRAYNDVKTTGSVGSGGALNGTYFENKYAMDCVGWVSFAIHHALGIDSNIRGSVDGYTFSYFVVPTNCSGTDTSIMEKVNGALKPGDILVNSHHVMVYVGNDTIVDSAGAGPPKGAISQRTLAEYGGGYNVAYRVRSDVAAKINKSDATTIFNGSAGINNVWVDGSSSSSSSSVATQDGRIVDVNDKLPLFKHILLTEKYNFNSIKWKTYGHGYDGKDSDMQEDLNLGLKYPKDESNTSLDKFIDFVLPYLQNWMIPLGMNAGVSAKGDAEDIANNPLFTYSVIRKAMSDIIVNRYDVSKCVLTTKYKQYDIIKVTETYVSTSISPSFDQNSFTKLDKFSGFVDSSTVQVNEETVQSGVKEAEEVVSKEISIEPEYYIKQALTFDTKISNEFEYKKYSDSDVENLVEDGVGFVGREEKTGETINEVYNKSTSIENGQVIVTYYKKVGNYNYIYRTWRDEIETKESKNEAYTYDDVINYNKGSGLSSSSSVATDENGTDQTVTYNGKTITYSTAFASQTKTPEELGLKYDTYEGANTTVYDGCIVCNENADEITASGIKLVAGRKIVAKHLVSDAFELGDWVYIPSWGYALVADTGGYGKASDPYHLDCFVGMEGDTITDGASHGGVTSEMCLNQKNTPASGVKVYEREPGNLNNVTVYRIKAEDIPEELLKGNSSTTNTSSSSTSSSTKVDSIDGFLFIGDSLTAGLKDNNCLAEATVMGVVSSSATSWNKYLNGQSTGLDFSHISLPESAKGVSVTLGINSLNIENGGSTTGVVDNTLSQTKTLLTKLEVKYLDTPIYVQRVFPISSKTSDYDIEKTNQVVNEYNEKMKAYCSEKGYIYVDATSGLLDSEGNLDSTVTSDGVHFTASGYSTWESNIRSVIANGGTSMSSDSNVDSADFTEIDEKYYKQLEIDDEINKVDLMNSKPSEYLEYLSKGTEFSNHVGYSRAYLTFSYSSLKRLFSDYFNDTNEVPFAYGSSLGYKTFTGANSLKASGVSSAVEGNIETVPGAVQVPDGLGKVHTWTIWNHVNENYNPESTWPANSSQGKLILHLTDNNERALHGELSGNITANSKRMICYGEWLASAMVAQLGGTQGNPEKNLNIGDFVFIIQDNGTFYPIILTDTKVQFNSTYYDPNPANEWGHDNGQCMVEFQGHTSSWRDVPSTPSEFDHYIKQVYVVGNVYTTPEYLNDIEKAAKDVGLDPANMINPKEM